MTSARAACCFSSCAAARLRPYRFLLVPFPPHDGHGPVHIVGRKIVMRVDLPSEIPLKTEKQTLVVDGPQRGQNPHQCKGLGGRDADKVLEVRANGKQPYVLGQPRPRKGVDIRHPG